MNAQAVYIYLKSKTNRQSLINKIENGLKHQNISYSKDPEVEEFQKGFLENWDDLTKFPPAAEDLQGIPKDQMKQEIKNLKMQFCEWVSGQDAIAEGFAYASNKKEQLKDSIKAAPGSMKRKIQSGISSVFGSNNEEPIKKIGRNDPCPCGSDLKYKKCCGRP